MLVKVSCSTEQGNVWDVPIYVVVLRCRRVCRMVVMFRRRMLFST